MKKITSKNSKKRGKLGNFMHRMYFFSFFENIRANSMELTGLPNEILKEIKNILTEENLQT